MASLSGLGTRRRSRRFPIIPLFSWLFLLAAVGLLLLELIRFSQQAARYSSDVVVAGIPVGGLSAVDAATRIEEAYAQPVTLWYADSPILLDPASIGFRTNREAMLAQARTGGVNDAGFWGRFLNYLLGRESDSRIGVDLVADYQAALLRQIVNDIAQRYDRPPGEGSYDVQTLTFRAGEPGYVMDVDSALPLIDAALRDPLNRQVVLPVAGTDGRNTQIDSLRQLIIAYLDSEGFVYDGQSTIASVYIIDLETGEEVNLLGDVAFSAASTVKVSILVDFYRNTLFAPSDDYAFLMAQSLLCSNNSSSNLLMEYIGGDNPDPLAAGISDVSSTQQYIGAGNSYISAPLYLGAGQQLFSIPAPTTAPNPNYNTGADPYNQTTTEDLATIFNMIYDCAEYGSGLMAAYPDGSFTPNECHQMLELMSANDLERLLQGGIPTDAQISHKNGWLENVHGDAGIVFPANGRDYVIAVFVWENTDFFSYLRAWPLIEGVSRAAWNYFVPDQPLIAARSDLPPDAQACTTFAPPYGEVNLDDINSWRSQ